MDESRDSEQAKPKRQAKKARRLFGGLRHRNARAQRAFLAAYAKTGNISRSAKAARIDRDTHCNWLKFPGPAGEAYRAAFAVAEEMAADVLEEEARRRAVNGLVRFQFDRHGNPLKHPVTGKPYTETEYSDLLLRELLKGNRPAKYRDQPKEAVSVEDVVRLFAAFTAAFRAEVFSIVADAAIANRLLSAVQLRVSKALALPDVPATAAVSEPVAIEKPEAGA
jgi:hypothetical protein